MRKLAFTVSVRLSSEDKQRFDRLLQRFSDVTARSKSARFRSLLLRLSEHLSFETRFDNPGFDELDDPVDQ